jgi:hypothetical protein
MAATAGFARRRRADAPADGRAARALTPAELAWVALIPCALAGLAAILVLGPPLGHALFKRPAEGLWPPTWWEAKGRAEPVKQARYLLAVLAPLLLAAFVLVAARRPPRLRPRAIRAIVRTSQAALLAFLALAVLGQRNVVLPGRHLPAVFGLGTLVVAAALVALALLALRRPRAADWLARLARETRARRGAALAVAAVLAALWLLEAVTTDRLVEDMGQMNWALTDVFAVLDGRTPLVDYHLVYAKLLPYPAALVLTTFGTTAFVYTTFMTVLDVLALLAVYALLRRVARSSLLALGLFVPFVALSDVGHTLIMPAMWPMRYGGTYLLAWLTARHLDGARPRRAWVLFVLAGLVTLDDLEFGLAALLASAAALLCARPPRSARDLTRLAGSVAAGVLAAIAAVCALTLVRAGTLPRPGVLLEWPRIFSSLGWFSLPMPTAGLHLAIYATFVAALLAAVVRLARGARDALLTSMLAWSGVFGLLAGAYYVGRSDDIKLYSLFSAWGLALALLTIACVRALAARGWRAPTLAELLVLLGFALAICTVVRMPAPNEQLARLTQSQPPPGYRPATERFVARHTRRGEKVAILLPESFRIAYELGLTNVSPYVMSSAIVTRAQLRTLIDAIRREHVREIFAPMPGYILLTDGTMAPEQLQVLLGAGFQRGESRPGFLELRGSGS